MIPFYQTPRVVKYTEREFEWWLSRAGGELTGLLFDRYYFSFVS